MSIYLVNQYWLLGCVTLAVTSLVEMMHSVVPAAADTAGVLLAQLRGLEISTWKLTLFKRKQHKEKDDEEHGMVSGLAR